MPETERVAFALIERHGERVPEYLLRQIERARGVAAIAAWHEVGQAVADILEPIGEAH